jgi:hypothetical protein
MDGAVARSVRVTRTGLKRWLRLGSSSPVRRLLRSGDFVRRWLSRRLASTWSDSNVGDNDQIARELGQQLLHTSTAELPGCSHEVSGHSGAVEMKLWPKKKENSGLAMIAAGKASDNLVKERLHDCRACLSKAWRKYYPTRLGQCCSS